MAELYPAQKFILSECPKQRTKIATRFNRPGEFDNSGRPRGTDGMTSRFEATSRDHSDTASRAVPLDQQLFSHRSDSGELEPRPVVSFARCLPAVSGDDPLDNQQTEPESGWLDLIVEQ